MRNNIVLYFPDSLFLLSSSNEGKTDGDILEMGERLAKEVRNYINENCPDK